MLFLKTRNGFSETASAGEKISYKMIFNQFMKLKLDICAHTFQLVSGSLSLFKTAGLNDDRVLPIIAKLVAILALGLIWIFAAILRIKVQGERAITEHVLKWIKKLDFKTGQPRI